MLRRIFLLLCGWVPPGRRKFLLLVLVIVLLEIFLITYVAMAEHARFESLDDDILQELPVDVIQDVGDKLDVAIGDKYDREMWNWISVPGKNKSVIWFDDDDDKILVLVRIMYSLEKLHFSLLLIS